MIDEILQLPDVSFIDNLSLEDIQTQMITDYQNKYEELTGEICSLRRADPMSILLYSCSVQIYQALLNIDKAGKMSLLKYSYSEFLDNLGALKGMQRLPAGPARVMIEFTLSEERDEPVGIPAGTRVTNGQEIYYATQEYAEIPAGETKIQLDCECLTSGVIGNGYQPGEINVLTDPIGYVMSVANTTTSAGGTDIEDDESFIERIYNGPSSYSVAGPEDAYVYWAKTYNSAIGDVKVNSPNPVEVVITFLMEDGSIPEETVINGLEEFLMDENIRPLTDEVTVQAPTTTSYNIDIKYFINRSAAAQAESIRKEVEQAVEEYISWQQSKIGRDINPSELIRCIINAGAKRVEVAEPIYTAVDDYAVAAVNTKSVVYGGLEND